MTSPTTPDRRALITDALRRASARRITAVVPLALPAPKPAPESPAA